MSSTISGRIRIKRWKVDNRKVARVLANDPTVQASLMGYGKEIARRTELRMSKAHAPKKIQNPRYQGHYWAFKPQAVVRNIKTGAPLIRLKPGAEVLVFGTKAGPAVAGVIPVALVVADHPFSRSYEFGLDEFPQVGAMGAAITAIANSHPRRLKRRYGKP